MDDENKIVCAECDFQFWVVWQNDAEAQSRLRAGQSVIEYCPRCGESVDPRPLTPDPRA